MNKSKNDLIFYPSDYDLNDMNDVDEIISQYLEELTQFCLEND